MSRMSQGSEWRRLDAMVYNWILAHHNERASRIGKFKAWDVISPAQAGAVVANRLSHGVLSGWEDRAK